MTLISISDLAVLSSLTRWQNVPTVRRETVAEHLAQVALIVMKLHSESYAFDLGHALKLALLHDVPEIWLSDIPHNVAGRFPQIAAAKASAEAQIVTELLPEWQAEFDELAAEQTMEAKVVKLADSLQVLQFCESELALGDNRAIAKVYAECQAIVQKLTADLPQEAHDKS